MNDLIKMYVNNRCVGCCQCVAFCGQHAITAKGKAVISEKCKECRVCMSYCPMKAIETKPTESKKADVRM